MHLKTKRIGINRLWMKFSVDHFIKSKKKKKKKYVKINLVNLQVNLFFGIMCFFTNLPYQPNVRILFVYLLFILFVEFWKLLTSRAKFYWNLKKKRRKMSFFRNEHLFAQLDEILCIFFIYSLFKSLFFQNEMHHELCKPISNSEQMYAKCCSSR